jgi:hypothetical protein
VRRRYSDFYSLRDTLVRLHPTLVIPPIPEKHSMADYAAKPTKAKEDEAIIDHRKRMLTSFLNRCRRMQEVREDGVFWKFLEPNATWVSKTSSYLEKTGLTIATEYCSTSTTSHKSSQELPESAAIRSCKPHFRSQLPANTILDC